MSQEDLLSQLFRCHTCRVSLMVVLRPIKLSRTGFFEKIVPTHISGLLKKIFLTQLLRRVMCSCPLTPSWTTRSRISKILGLLHFPQWQIFKSIIVLLLMQNLIWPTYLIVPKFFLFQIKLPNNVIVPKISACSM